MRHPADHGVAAVRHDFSLLTDNDVYLFNEGTHFDLHRKLGAHQCTVDGVRGTYFAVWAPSAESVMVFGDFNQWNRSSHPLRPHASSGIWEGFVPGVGQGTIYKYLVAGRYGGRVNEKADPFAFHAETPPKTASIVWDIGYEWGDAEWMSGRKRRNALNAPISIYEVHLGSWMRVRDDHDRWMSYREIAPKLADYVADMGYTHVELLPIMEHPFYGSWGYQTTGYFAPTSRFGTPQDFMYLVDHLHQRGIGVILDWVPSHFPNDPHGLATFDGTSLYEHQDPREGFHPDWNSYIFNYGRHKVQAFLISSAMFWLETYHADGLRVDAVASMLYRDYSRKAGEWIPNQHGGRENLEAIALLRRMNEEAYRRFPDVQTTAEESTAWPMVSRPTYVGGLGFGFKWDMGWMHDTLEYMRQDPIHRSYHHHELTFRAVYAFNENFILPLSHDEVVHGKGSLLARMPGDAWRQFANLRLLFGYMFGQPGKKLLFMGGDFAQGREWYHESSLDWDLLAIPWHEGVRRLVRDLNRLYRTLPALHELDSQPAGFQWAELNDSANSVLSFVRLSSDSRREDGVLVVCNFTPVVRQGYRVGVPYPGQWREVLNTDAAVYEGSGIGNGDIVSTDRTPMHGRAQSLSLTLPPLGALFLKHEGA